MEETTTRTRIAKSWSRIRQEGRNSMINASNEPTQIIERPLLKSHKCGSPSHLANYLTKKVIGEVYITELEEPLKKEEEETEINSI
ncbi:hypothetical protein O181_022396 [Austropuccinia psidii MF-1]|uniref:Uncharacterized protein n=1 Tax=Austropuccinia psidii MF-1 TaxID=1389203 RepID=A0A9Q3GWN1_9BASI|nr:hypothetical protein [Austropuccinia psidii MF-1]